MIDDDTLQQWFCREVLPLERMLVSFIRRNWREPSEVIDLRQEVYVRLLEGARRGLPDNTGAYAMAVARNHLINRARRAQIVSFEMLADLDATIYEDTAFTLDARDELRRVNHGMAQLPPRCREVLRMRKVEGYSTRETASALGVTVHTVEKQLTLGMRALVDFMLGGTGRIRRPADYRIDRKDRA